MHEDLEALYDAHAHRLYAHCWSLVGDVGAADSLRDTLTEAVRHPPRGETVLWLHHLARTVCAERGAFSRHGRPVFAQAASDPLLNAAGGLLACHREALLLSAGEWLEVRDIARVMGVSPSAVRELLHDARTALERVVLDALMRGIADPARHMDVIAAFEKGRLPNLLARRAPAWAPAPLRDQLLDAAEAGPAPAEPTVSTGPLVVIDSAAEAAADSGRDRARRHRAALKAFGGVTGVAATVAAGLMMTWPSAGGGTVNALGPQEGNSRFGPVPAGSVTDEPDAQEPQGGEQKNDAPTPTPTPTTEEQPPRPQEPAGSDGGATAPAKPSEDDTPSTPSDTPSTSRQKPPSSPPESPEQQPDGGPRQESPLDPITDIVGSVTSPILGGLTGR